MHLSSASPKEGGGGGGRDPGLIWGLCEWCNSKFLYFPTRGGYVVLQSPQYLAKPSTRLANPTERDYLRGEKLNCKSGAGCC